MILRTPGYYPEFRCSADKCSDSCCIGWEIGIDPDTAAFYNGIGGEFGEKLRKNIAGDIFILGEGERCPFLNSRNLCDIYIELGEESLCRICTDHPRYFEWFGTFKEGGVGLCCEEAAKLILTRDFSLMETDIPDEDCGECDQELLRLLISARSEIFRHIGRGEPAAQLGAAVRFAEELQDNIDCGELRLPRWKETPAAQWDYPRWALFMAELEPFSPDWLTTLRRYAALETPCGSFPEEQRRLAMYFIFRYFLKGVFDGEVVSRLKLASMASGFICWLWSTRAAETGSCDLSDRVRLAKDLSREIEYNEDNLSALLDELFLS